MVKDAAVALLVVLSAWAGHASQHAPTYALQAPRTPRSFDAPAAAAADSQRTVRRLIGGHLKIKPDYGSAINSLNYNPKSDKYAGAPSWSQGVWDDGMLMSSAGEGKDAKIKEEDEDKKTLADQVAEGKYGLIQNELFAKAPKRPGIVSYTPNSETRAKDNIQSLGGLQKDEIWLAEDHLLVLTGGSFPERTKENERRPWPPIDDYQAPQRQVKLPQKPKVPPPFPVRLYDDGPLVFLTPNGSVPAPLFPPFFEGGEGALPPPAFPYAPSPDAPSGDPGNSSAGGAPYPAPPFPFLPGNASEGPFPFFGPMNASFPEGFPPGAAFLPPPSNQTDLYDEDDPSIYYPPPYNFSYHADYNSSVPAGPLVPGIVLPPPPDFFAPMEEKSTESSKTTSKPTSTYARPKPTHKPSSTPVYRKQKSRPTTTEPTSTQEPSTITTPPTVEITTVKKPLRVVQISQRPPVRVQNLPEEITTRPKTEKPVYKTRQKLTSKPLSVSVIYDYPEPVYGPKQQISTEKPYILYKVPEKTPVISNEIVTSTPVPLRAYYSNVQNEVPTTKLQPVYKKPTENAVASFYFYDEQPKASPSPASFFDGRNYYKTVPNPTPQQPQPQNVIPQTGFSPAVDVAYGNVGHQDAVFLWPQKHGPRTLTQEYFSVQKPRQQNVFVQQVNPRPDFYQQIADIQSTIDLFTTKRPKAHAHRAHTHKPKAITARPVYQFSYQSNPRPEQLSFRAPKLDPEPFRPMVSYSKPFNLDNEFNAITPPVSPAYHQQYLIENVQVTTETPTSTRYYPKTKTRDEDYDDTSITEPKPHKNRNHIPIQNEKAVPVIHRIPQISTTANPISHGYYTKQDERYLDDITKNSFDVFGKKLEDNTHDVHGLAVTPPLGTVRTPINNNINLQYAYEIVEQNPNPPSLDRDTLVNDRFPRPTINPDSESIHNVNAELVQPVKPPTLHGDTLVNERHPRPPINPDSEFIPIPNPGYRQPQQYRIQTQVQKPQYTEQFDLNRPSLAGDIAVNYRRPLPPVNPDAEWISPGNSAGEGRPGSFVSYRLPGEGAHVYFLTPQAAQQVRDKYRSPGYGR